MVKEPLELGFELGKNVPYEAVVTLALAELLEFAGVAVDEQPHATANNVRF